MNTKLLIGALALAGAIVLPIGAALAAPPAFSFGFSVGEPPPGPGPGGPHFGGGFGPGGPPRHDDRCMSPRDILADLADQGFSRFTPVDRDRHTFTIDARRHFRWYELTVDSCSGDIIDQQRIMHP